MDQQVSRRAFITGSLAAASLGPAALANQVKGAGRDQPAGPVFISSGNGRSAVARAFEVHAAGGNVLDAVIEGVNLVEDDPKDMSVGYGGLPNEEGVVELDSSVMYGPTHRAGAVASLRGIKNPSKIARLVMERTDHVLLVGAGALRFAKAHGFKEQDLLTDDARRAWLKWKESNKKGDWLPPRAERGVSSSNVDYPFTYGTINCNGIDAAGNLAGVTTTSGLSYKISGRVGDSPLIGCGLYVDNEVGAAGSTGRGEEVILNNGAFSVVENMRNGMAPQEACLATLKRMADHARLAPRLWHDNGRPKYQVKFYALNKKGEYGGACMLAKGNFAVHDGNGGRLEPCAHLFER